jgi:hypothetical protein
MDGEGVILRILSLIIVICPVMPTGSAACGENVRISRLNEAPTTIQELAKAIDGKKPAQIREIILRRYGPSQHVGSGLDIEGWDVAEGRLVFHPASGPFFNPKGSQTIWLLKTTNKALPNVLGRFEMISLPGPEGMQNWLGQVSLSRNRTYAFADGFPLQPDNFFKLHPSGRFKIQFAGGCTDDTLLESLSDNVVLGRLIFAAENRSETVTFSIVTGRRELILRGDRTPGFEMHKSWNEFWR